MQEKNTQIMTNEITYSAALINSWEKFSVI